MRFFLCLLVLFLLLASHQVSAQVPDSLRGENACDSMAILPAVRQEAAMWHRIADSYQLEADNWHTLVDSLEVEVAVHAAAYRKERLAFNQQAVVLANQTARGDTWRRKARRRSWLNALLTALGLGTGYALLKPSP